MLFWQIVFVLSCFVVFYNYAGYAVIVYLLNRLKSKPKAAENDAQFFPTVSFIVAAFNEEDCIEKKVINSLQQRYPSDRIEFIFITDGSTDRTADIIGQYRDIRVMHSPDRKGKSAALNRAVAAASNDILIFSDANTILNDLATRNITRHYFEARVGGVAGEKKVLSGTEGNDVGAGEGLYWKYESYLKKLDSDFYSVVGAAGELFSLRRNLFEPVSHDVILDDFIISMKVAEKGYRIVYEPEAYAMELPSFSMQDEQKRKVRIAAGGFQAIGMLRSLLRFWKQPALSFLYISHRLLRWTLSPLCLILAFVSNAVLLFETDSFFFRMLFAAQLAFYGMAAFAAYLPKENKLMKVFKLPYYFVFMNLSVIQGFFRYLRGKQPATWEKARRMQASLHTD